MAYDKLSLASFKDALKNSTKYKSATGARRAVGKATTLSDTDKDAARKLIDAHFGPSTEAKPAKTPKAKATKVKAPKAEKPAKAAKAPKAPKAVKTAAVKTPAAKTGAKRGPKPGYKKAPPQEATAHTPAAELMMHGQQLSTSTLRDQIDLENFASIATQIRIAEKTITTVSAGLNAVTAAKEKFPEAELAPIAEDMSNTMLPALGIFRSIVDKVKSFQATAAVHSVVAKPARQAKAAKVEETEDFDDSIPEGSNVNGVGAAAKTSASDLYGSSIPVAQG